MQPSTAGSGGNKRRLSEVFYLRPKALLLEKSPERHLKLKRAGQSRSDPAAGKVNCGARERPGTGGFGLLRLLGAQKS